MDGMIKLVILDVDGVLTDGTKQYSEDGKVQSKRYCDKDWTAIKRFKALGIPVICITGDPYNVLILKNRNLPVIVSRGKGFHADKVQYLSEACRNHGCDPKDVVFVGDDLFDSGIMKAVGHPFCVADSPRSVRQIASPLPVSGGENVVMHLFEYLEEGGLIERVAMETVMTRIYELDVLETF